MFRILFALFSAWIATEAHAKCASSPVHLNFSNPFLMPGVEVLVNGEKKIFIYDTGTDYTMLTMREKEKYKLTSRKVRVAGVAGTATLGVTNVASLSVDGSSARNYSMPIEIEQSEISAYWDGILGSDIALANGAELLYASALVNTYHPDCAPEWIGTGARVAITSTAGVHVPVFNIQVNGVTLTGLLDSGADFSRLSAAAARRAGLILNKSPSRTVIGYGARGRTTGTANITTLNVGNAVFRNFRLPVLDSETNSGFDLILGTDFLAKRKVFISRKRGYIFFDLGNSTGGHIDDKFTVSPDERLHIVGAAGSTFARERLNRQIAEKQADALAAEATKARRAGQLDTAEEKVTAALSTLSSNRKALVERFLIRVAAGKDELARTEMTDAIRVAPEAQWFTVVYHYLLENITEDDFTKRVLNDPRTASSRCGLSSLMNEFRAIKKIDPNQAASNPAYLCPSS